MSTGFERIGKDPRLQDHWIRRVIAFVIDSIIAWVCTFFIGVIIWLPFLFMAVVTGLPWHLFDILSFPFFAGIITVLYFVFFETYYGGTIGKRMFRLKTSRLNGQDLPLDSAFIRNASKIHLVFVLVDTLIGLAMSGDPRQKATDRVAGTIVVSVDGLPFRDMQKAQFTANSCIQCGKRLPPNAKYCPHCGKEQE